MGVAFLLLAVALVSTTAHGQQAPAAGAENRRCMECHRQAHLTELGPEDRLIMVKPSDPPPLGEPPAFRPGLFLDQGSMDRSVHGRLLCIDCHQDARELPHGQVLEAVSCGKSCHVQSQGVYDHSTHAEAAAAGEVDAPTCASCHGTHGILPSRDRNSLTHPLNVVKVCSNCHAYHATSTAASDIDNGEHVLSYLQSVHGQALSKSGLVSVATCIDCHRHHDIRPTGDPGASTHRDQIPSTCGRCHLGVVEIYQESVHGRLMNEGDERAPVCTDCHAGHEITHASLPELSRDIVNECGQCHDRADMTKGRRATFYDTYRSSYHGQVNRLGSKRAARCSDCHGAHDILPNADPASRVHEDNLVNTCQSCHENANANFVQFDPHADYRDREHYPLLHGVWWYFIIMMSSAFGFFGLHSIFWFLRSLRERAKEGKPAGHTHRTHGIRRFTAVNRVNHGLLIISFFGLTLTGMPLLFSDQDWALNLASIFGGVYAAGIWHRTFAVILIANLTVHFYSIFMTLRAHKGPIRTWLFGPNSMVPRLKDFLDCFGMIRWFFLGGKKPTFDRWAYWEKFDYWAEIGGTMIIGGSGLLLWFPAFFSSFLPGWLFNIAMIVHGYEAMLAVGFIFTIHFFNAHLRPEKFPVDDVIFTGQVPEEEFKHERGEEYARLLQSGQIDDYRVAPAPKWQRSAAIFVGAVAMFVGMTLVALIILAGLGVL